MLAQIGRARPFEDPRYAEALPTRVPGSASPHKTVFRVPEPNAFSSCIPQSILNEIDSPGNKGLKFLLDHFASHGMHPYHLDCLLDPKHNPYQFH